MGSKHSWDPLESGKTALFSSLIFSGGGKTTTRRTVIRKFWSCGGTDIDFIGLNMGKMEFKHQPTSHLQRNKKAERW